MNRRFFLKSASLLSLSSFATNSFGFENSMVSYTNNELKELLPDQIPSNIIAFLGNIVNYPSHTVGIREGDNAAIEALLKLSDEGFKPGLEYADNWFRNLLNKPPEYGVPLGPFIVIAT